MNQQHSPSRSRRGQALAELAVMVPFLVIAMMGLLDLGRAFYYQVSLTNAVREAARYGSLQAYLGLSPSCVSGQPPTPTCPVQSNSRIQAKVSTELNNLFSPTTVRVTPDEATRTTDWNNCNASPSPDCENYQITVTATYNFAFITPIIGNLIGNNGILTLTSSAEMRTEY